MFCCPTLPFSFELLSRGSQVRILPGAPRRIRDVAAPRQSSVTSRLAPARRNVNESCRARRSSKSEGGPGAPSPSPSLGRTASLDATRRSAAARGTGAATERNPIGSGCVERVAKEAAPHCRLPDVGEPGTRRNTEEARRLNIRLANDCHGEWSGWAKRRMRAVAVRTRGLQEASEWVLSKTDRSPIDRLCHEGKQPDVYRGIATS